MKTLNIIVFYGLCIHFSCAQTVMMSKEGVGYFGRLEISPDFSISVTQSEDQRTSLDLGNGCVFVLAQNRIVKEAKSLPPLNLALLLVFRVGDRGVGLWYEETLAVRLKGGLNHDPLISVEHLMIADDLKRPDGRVRTVQNIGELSKFPTVLLRISTNRTKSLPTNVDHNWEMWDIVKGVRAD